MLAQRNRGRSGHEGRPADQRRGNSRLYVKEVDLNAGGVAFYSGSSQRDIDLECSTWIDAILHDKEPVVKPEQALVVTEILEAIYESARTGKTVYFQ